MKNSLIKKYTNKHRTFKLSPCGRFYTVYMDGRMNGFIWNNEKEILVDGDLVTASEFFR